MECAACGKKLDQRKKTHVFSNYYYKPSEGKSHILGKFAFCNDKCKFAADVLWTGGKFGEVCGKRKIK